MFTFRGYHKTGFNSLYATAFFQQQCMSTSVALHPCLHLVLEGSLKKKISLAIPVGVIQIYCGFNLHFLVQGCRAHEYVSRDIWIFSYMKSQFKSWYTIDCFLEVHVYTGDGNLPFILQLMCADEQKLLTLIKSNL